MKLDCVLVACNDNPKYLDFWPIVRQAWWDLAGLPCIMVYVADDLPEHLAQDPAVRHFKPIPGWPTATQAQCIRLLYPSLMKCDGAVMLSDMDMIPMQRDWFVKGFEPFGPEQFVSLRGIDESCKQIYMCYVGATPKMWGELFSVSDEDDVRKHLEDWSKAYPADGIRGGDGWCTDQTILYMRVKQIQEILPDRIGLIPWTQEFQRLDRANFQDWLQLTEDAVQRVLTAPYIDFHMPPTQPFLQRILEIFSLRLSNFRVKSPK